MGVSVPAVPDHRYRPDRSGRGLPRCGVVAGPLFVTIKPDARDRVMSSLRAHFRPEFLNRVDDIVLFKPLTQREIENVVELMAGELRARLADRQMTLELTDEARGFIAGDVSDGAAIRVGVADGEITVTYDYPSQ